MVRRLLQALFLSVDGSPPGVTMNPEDITMILCDLCGEPKECRPREIEGKEYDVCADCWNPIAAKLKGKGRMPKEAVFLPSPPISAPEPQETKPVPGEPPKIWGQAGMRH
jgi:hypothetical protein